MLIALVMVATTMPTGMAVYAQGDEELPKATQSEEVPGEKAEEDTSEPREKVETKELTAGNDRYEVTVSYDDSAKIPEGAGLVLTEFRYDDEQFIAARDALVADENSCSVFSKTTEEERKGLGMAAFDLTIYDRDGNVVEPQAKVRVSFMIKELPEGADIKTLADSIEIQHLSESSGEVVVEKIASISSKAEESSAFGTIKVNEKEAVIEAETVVDSFSTYTITWGTGAQSREVILHFVDDKGNDLGNGFTYKGQSVDNGTTSLADLIPANGIFDLGQITKDGYSLTNVHVGRFDDMNGTTPTIIRNEVERADNVLRYWTFRTGSDTAGVSANEFPAGTTHLYLVYNSTEMASHGGSSEEAPPDLADLGHNKVAESNNDGTYKLSLSVTGSAQNQEADPKVNVIVVFDTSSSMVSNTIPDSSSMTRLEAAKDQVNELATELLALNTEEHPDAVEMALVTFNRNAAIQSMGAGNWTKSASAFTSVVGTYRNGPVTNNSQGTAGNGNTGINTAKGTNWAEGIQKAIDLMQDDATDNDPTYVLFITDGAPSQYWPSGEATGTYAEGEGCYLGARDEARNLVGGEGAILYALFTYGSTTDYSKDYLGKLVDYAYDDASAKGDYRFNVADNETFKNKLKSILAIISMNFAYANVSIDDGVTGLSTVVFERIATDSFTYSITYKDYSSETQFAEKTITPAVNSDGSLTIPAVSYKVPDKEHEGGLRTIQTKEVTITGAEYSESSKSVVWDMKKVGLQSPENLYLLEEGWTYTVSFDIWPSQVSYDIVAALNNGILNYGDPYKYTDENGNVNTVEFEEYKTQVTDTRPYTLLTNTHFVITYQQVTEIDNPDGTVSYELGPVKPIEDPYTYQMPLVSQEMPVQKRFAHSINAQDPYKKIRFYLMIDGGYYQSDGTRSDTLVPDTGSGSAHTIYMDLDDNNHWTGSIFIAPGVIKDERASGGKMQVLETGHEYSLYEEVLEGPIYEYEFTPQTVRPMVINGELTYLVKQDKYNKPAESDTLYEIGEDIYFPAPADAQLLVGTNRKTAELDITKIVSDPKGLLPDEREATETFTYRVTLMIPDGSDPAGIVGYEYVPRVQDNAFLLYGYQETDEGQGFEEDVERFSGKTYRAWNTLVYRDLVEYETVDGKIVAKKDENGNIIWKIPAVDGYHTVTYDMTLKQDEVIRFTNLPSGTKYTIQEIYANKYPADNSGGTTSGRAPVDDPGNIAQQGYEITKIQSTGVNEGTAQVNGDTISGEISNLDTRYYNQFTNTIGAHVEAELKVTKQLEGYEWSGERYYFDLTGEDDAPLPGGIGGRTSLYTKAASGSDDVTQSFGTVRFTEAGEYTYIIQERTPTDPDDDNVQESDAKPGIIYDTSQKRITISVKTKEGGFYIDSIKGEDGTDYLSADLTSDPAIAEVTITNEYKAEGSVVLEVTKAVEGAEWPEGGKIIFTLSSENGPLPENNTVTLTEAGTKQFDPINYTLEDAGKTYTYTISEDGFGDGWTGSGDITATVEVTDNGEGALITKITYTPEDATVINTYKAEGSVSVPAYKKLVLPDGTTGPRDAEWTFTLTADDGGPMPEEASYTVAADETVVFGPISFTQEDIGKTYTYTVTESGTVKGVTNDKTPKTITVSIADNKNGTLSVTASFDGAEITDEAPLTFTNTYSVEPVETSFAAKKIARGFDLSDGQFTFQLKAGTNTAEGNIETPMPADAIAANDAEGNIQFGKIVYAVPGEYTYTITEVVSDAEGFTYDTHECEVRVTVTDNGDGTLTVSSPEYSGSTFTNEYEAPKIDIPVTKVWEDRDDAESARPVSITVTLLADGKEVDGGRLTLSADTGWTGTFTGLPKYAEDGKTEIVYSVAEEHVVNYTARTEGNAKEGFVITNTYESDTPRTGDSNDLWLCVSMMAVSLLTAVLIVLTSKRRGRRQ